VVDLSLFTQGKIFKGIPEYVAIKNEGENNTYLFRMLSGNERFSQFHHISFIITDKDLKNGITKGRPCIFLSVVNSLEEAEEMVNSYHFSTESVAKEKELTNGKYIRKFY